MKSKTENKAVASNPQRRKMAELDCEICTRTVAGPSPFKLERILVPVDFSDCSKKALQYAAPFATQFKAQMIFLHVLAVHYAAVLEIEVGGYDPLTGGDLRRQAEQQLASLIREKVPAKAPTRIEVRHGAPAIEIVNTAKETKAGLIIMSTHGHAGRIHAFIGSVAGDVTRLAPCPVLVVRERERDFVPSEYNPLNANQPLPTLVSAPNS